jgi:hypothetical protein
MHIVDVRKIFDVDLQDSLSSKPSHISTSSSSPAHNQQLAVLILVNSACCFVPIPLVLVLDSVGK